MARWLAIAALALAAGCGDDGPQLSRLATRQAVPVEVRRELDQLARRLDRRLGGVMACAAPVDVVLVDAVEGGDARYRRVAHRSRIEVAIPTTPERFRESVVHEFAHHLDTTCERFDSLRAELHEQFGLGRAWATGDNWYLIPSERWAEALVVYVNGQQIRHGDRMRVDHSTLDAIDRWVDRF